jgi:hypothetical protein
MGFVLVPLRLTGKAVPFKRLGNWERVPENPRRKSGAAGGLNWSAFFKVRVGDNRPTTLRQSTPQVRGLQLWRRIGSYFG